MNKINPWRNGDVNDTIVALEKIGGAAALLAKALRDVIDTIDRIESADAARKADEATLKKFFAS